MAHQRIRKFNSKDTYPEQKLDNDFCQAVVTRGGRTVWLRGQCPQNLDDAVNLKSHLICRTIKIQDKTANWILTPELKSA